jgi:predicted O-methyltransferase YrrM
LLLGIAFAHQPARVLVVGSFQAAAIMWLASGAGLEANCIGVDIDESANEVARKNLSVLSLSNVRIRHLDGHQAGELFDGKIDLVLLDAEEKRNGQTSKAIYTTLLSALEPYLADRALILAHDASWPMFARDFQQLKEYLRQSGRFDRCVTLPIDRYGLLIARRGQP